MPLHIIGHRGARGEAPENTLCSFLRASQAGVQGIELDVRMSRDGVLFTFHDKTLQRTTQGKGKLHLLPSETLRSQDARYGLPHWPHATPIPTLEEVLTQCPAHLHYQLEVKGFMQPRYLRTLVQQLNRLIQQLNMEHRVVVTSEDVRVLRYMRRQNATIALGYVCQYRHRLPLRLSHYLDCKWLIANHRIVDHTLMKKAQQLGIKVSCWTVNNLDEAERLAQLQVHSLITDYPTAMLAHFQQRSQPLA